MRTEHISGLSSCPSHLVLPFWPPSLAGMRHYVCPSDPTDPTDSSPWPTVENSGRVGRLICGSLNLKSKDRKWVTVCLQYLERWCHLWSALSFCSLKDEWIHRCPRRGQVLRELGSGAKLPLSWKKSQLMKHSSVDIKPLWSIYLGSTWILSA